MNAVHLRLTIFRCAGEIRAGGIASATSTARRRRLSSISKPSGSIKCRWQSLLAHSLITLPVFGGISHASRHGDLLQAQLDEVLANLDSLIATARALRPGLPVYPAPRRGRRYVRDAADLGIIDGVLRAPARGAADHPARPACAAPNSAGDRRRACLTS